MADTVAGFVASLPGLALAFALTLCRAGGVVAVLPGIGEAEIPAMPRAGIALALTILLLPQTSKIFAGYGGAEGLPVLAIAACEVVIGLFLGWLARMITLALPIAGQIIATQTGLASVLQQDPSLGAQTTAISVCFSLAAPVLVLSTGLYRLPLAALAGSYREIPPGLAFDGAGAAAMVVAATSGAFALALRLASPFVLLAVIWQVALGVAARILPRLQVHFASLPGQVLTGLALLAFGSTVLLAAASDSIRQAWLALPGVL